MLIHRDIVEQIGLPDPRFVITWDDAIYGWLASQVTEVACVETLVLRRIRRQRKISLVVRHLSEASDVARYHSMRNRAYVAHYFRRHGAFHPVGFRFGTALSFCKEVFRLVAVERSVSLNSLSSLVRGIADGRRLMRDATWQPMPPLTTDYYRSGQQ
jgi:GT2 family glycosyltransferase